MERTLVSVQQNITFHNSISVSQSDFIQEQKRNSSSQQMEHLFRNSDTK